MRRLALVLLAVSVFSVTGCAVYVPPPPRAYVVAPAPVVVVPGWGYPHWHRW